MCDCAKFGTDYGRFKEYEGVPAYPYKVGYMFKAEELFDPTLSDIGKVIPKGFRDEHPKSMDFAADAPGHQVIYDIVTRFHAQNDERPKRAM